MRSLILLLLFAVPLRASEAESDRERLRRISVEVERRRVLREQATDAVALENARKVVRDHESGAKKATDAQLAEARAVIRRAEEASGQIKPDESASLNLPVANMKTVQAAWRTLFGGSVTIAERAKSRAVSLKLPAMPRDELRRSLIAALRGQGISVIERPNGVLLDLEPESKAGK